MIFKRRSLYFSEFIINKNLQIKMLRFYDSDVSLMLSVLRSCPDVRIVKMVNYKLQKDEATQLLQILGQCTKLKKIYLGNIRCHHTFRWDIHWKDISLYHSKLFLYLTMYNLTSITTYFTIITLKSTDMMCQYSKTLLYWRNVFIYKQRTLSSCDSHNIPPWYNGLDLGNVINSLNTGNCYKSHFWLIWSLKGMRVLVIVSPSSRISLIWWLL